jgi:hypothetical protein
MIFDDINWFLLVLKTSKIFNPCFQSRRALHASGPRLWPVVSVSLNQRSFVFPTVPINTSQFRTLVGLKILPLATVYQVRRHPFLRGAPLWELPAGCVVSRAWPSVLNCGAGDQSLQPRQLKFSGEGEEGFAAPAVAG